MASNNTPAAVIAGYWYWKGELTPENIDSSRFTHLFAAFAAVDSDTYQVTFPTEYDTQFQTFPKTVKKRNSDVKVLLSIGGDTVHSTLASMVSRPQNRQTFIQSSVKLALDNNYDGLSLHWLFPNTTEEMANLGTFLSDWKKYHSSHPISLLRTAAVLYSSKDLSSLKYPIQAIVDSLDWINVVAYDIYTPVSSPTLTGPHAPLYNATSCELSVDAGVRAWIDAGVAANKLVLGLPFLGRSWALKYANNHVVFSPAEGPSIEVSDPIPYRKILVIRSTEKGFDPSYVTRYCYTATTWIAYDDKLVIFTKAIYAKLKGLRGYFAWHLDGDTSDWSLSTAASNAWNWRVDDPL